MAGQQVTIDFGTGYLQASYLRQHFEDFARELEVRGHTRLTIQGYAGSIAHFGYWAQQQVRKVSLWLGHASLQSTEAYLRADPTEKLEALAATIPPTIKRGQFRAPDKLLAMLQSTTHPHNYAQ